MSIVPFNRFQFFFIYLSVGQFWRETPICASRYSYLIRCTPLPFASLYFTTFQFKALDFRSLHMSWRSLSSFSFPMFFAVLVNSFTTSLYHSISCSSAIFILFYWRIPGDHPLYIHTPYIPSTRGSQLSVWQPLQSVYSTNQIELLNINFLNIAMSCDKLCHLVVRFPFGVNNSFVNLQILEGISTLNAIISSSSPRTQSFFSHFLYDPLPLPWRLGFENSLPLSDRFDLDQRSPWLHHAISCYSP